MREKRDEPSTGGVAAPALEYQSLKDWLIRRIAEHCGVPAAEVDVHEPLGSFGISSVDAVTLSGELEQRLGQRLSPVVVFDHPSIEKLARHLAKRPASPVLARAAHGSPVASFLQVEEVWTDEWVARALREEMRLCRTDPPRGGET